ncbi:glucose-1-phosphate uridylyltransferase [Alteromonadales bacterium TW-7]|nr:glucose-1-phosphate uridylyltransferase [Alteromonadales bacterium TW-7]
MKAVIPVAGLGTRMLPMTKAIPKEMLPIVDKPLIQYIVNECVAAGIKEIVLVTHSSKNAIENHFDTSYELEATLEKRVKRTLLEEVRSICPSDVTIMHVRQGEAKGLGHAILCAKPIVGIDDFVVVLPDVILDAYTANQKTENLAAMIARFNETAASQIMLEPVAQDDVSKYGIADINGVQLVAGESAKIKTMVEKPDVDAAPSSLAVVGRYVLSKNIWPLLAKTPVGAGGEIQLTDSIDALMAQETVEAFHMSGRAHDCGDKFGYLKAIVEYGMRDEKLGKEFAQHLNTLVNGENALTLNNVVNL